MTRAARADGSATRSARRHPCRRVIASYWHRSRRYRLVDRGGAARLHSAPPSRVERPSAVVDSAVGTTAAPYPPADAIVIASSLPCTWATRLWSRRTIPTAEASSQRSRARGSAYERRRTGWARLPPSTPCGMRTPCELFGKHVVHHSVPVYELLISECVGDDDHLSRVRARQPAPPERKSAGAPLALKCVSEPRGTLCMCDSFTTSMCAGPNAAAILRETAAATGAVVASTVVMTRDGARAIARRMHETEPTDVHVSNPAPTSTGTSGLI